MAESYVSLAKGPNPDPKPPCCNTYVISIDLHGVSKDDALRLAENFEWLIVNDEKLEKTIYQIQTAHVKEAR